MSNSYFQFKKFIVHQDLCAMKVCTDACLFGAWVSKLEEAQTAKTSLDIGAGTGLLSLMFAQRIKAIIDAVEIDADAAEQAKANFHRSPWRENLQLINASIEEFSPANTYDFILSNPPFFEGSLNSPDAKRNLALHSSHLSSAGLMDSVDRLLSEEGNFAVLIPFHLAKAYEEMAGKKHLFLNGHSKVRQTDGHDFFRSMMLFGRTQQPLVEDEITIKINGAYSEVFVHLLQDYYLYL